MNNFKKKCLSLVALVIAMGASVFAWHNHQTSGIEGIMAENIEALTNIESIDDGWIVTVYSPSRWVCKPGGWLCCPVLDC